MVFISAKDPSDWNDQISYLSTAAKKKKKCLSWRYRKFKTKVVVIRKIPTRGLKFFFTDSI